MKKNILQETFEKHVRLMKERFNLKEQDETDINAQTDEPVIDNDGTKRWYNKDGKLHRHNGPAVEYKDGSKEWWTNGERLKVDGICTNNESGKEERFVYKSGGTSLGGDVIYRCSACGMTVYDPEWEKYHKSI